MPGTLDHKLNRLESVLREMRSFVVAFSGGVDSSFLLRVAAGTPGIDHIAVTTSSATNPADEIAEATSLAAEFGSEHIVVPVNELETPGYAENPANRCYLCKQTLYPICIDLAKRRGFDFVIDGVNTDDLGDYRPGLLAASQFRVRHPLVEADMSKGDIRHLSRRFGLRTADKPASPCLSSRFPYGTKISRERLRQVETAEAELKKLGFRELRVRHLGHGARVEIAAGELARLKEPGVRRNIERRVLDAGFDAVEISRVALRSGSLNDALLAAHDDDTPS